MWPAPPAALSLWRGGTEWNDAGDLAEDVASVGGEEDGRDLLLPVARPGSDGGHLRGREEDLPDDLFPLHVHQAANADAVGVEDREDERRGRRRVRQCEGEGFVPVRVVLVGHHLGLVALASEFDAAEGVAGAHLVHLG